MRYVTWVDPDENWNPVKHTATEEEAIEIMHKVAEQMGKKYSSDEAAFWDFVVVNWAEIHEA